MGTDIYYHIQEKTTEDEREVWMTLEDDENYESLTHIGRNYLLFSVLANVRNGYGVAGIRSYDPVEPIAMPRDLPPDSDLDYEYMHSVSYLSFDEILDYFKEPHITTRYGVVTKQAYESWDGVTSPDSWSLGIGGGSTVVYDAVGKGIGQVLADDITHVMISWPVNINEELDYFKNIIETIKSEHEGELRIVFGFDC